MHRRATRRDPRMAGRCGLPSRAIGRSTKRRTRDRRWIPNSTSRQCTGGRRGRMHLKSGKTAAAPRGGLSAALRDRIPATRSRSTAVVARRAFHQPIPLSNGRCALNCIVHTPKRECALRADVRGGTGAAVRSPPWGESKLSSIPPKFAQPNSARIAHDSCNRWGDHGGAKGALVKILVERRAVAVIAR